MSKILAFFRNGAYPYESIFGLVINIARFNRVAPNAVYKHCQRQSLGMDLRNCMYASNFCMAFFPASRNRSSKRNFPGEFKRSAFALDCEIKYCPECIKLGYHSVFNCLPAVKYCLYHSLELCRLCTTCKKNLMREWLFTIPCEECGFCLAPLTIQARVRNDPQILISLYKFGKKYQVWYDNVVANAIGGSTLHRMIDGCSDYEADPVLYALVSSIGWPVLKPVVSNVFVRFVSWDMSNLSYPEQAWIDTCDSWAKIFLTGHESCLFACETTLGYWTGVVSEVEACLMSLVYFFVRLRLGFLSFRYQPIGCVNQMGFGYVTSLEAMLFGLVKIPPRLFRIYAAKLMFHIALYLDQGYAVKLRMSAFEGMFYGLAMRSITGTGRCIDFVGYTSYALRRCMKLNVIYNDQSLRLKRGQDGVFEISRKEETLKSVVINL